MKHCKLNVLHECKCVSAKILILLCINKCPHKFCDSALLVDICLLAVTMLKVMLVLTLAEGEHKKGTDFAHSMVTFFLTLSFFSFAWLTRAASPIITNITIMHT